MSLDLKGRRFCDGCGTLMAKAHRIDGRDEFCGTCYKRLFKVLPCACGAGARVRPRPGVVVQCPACVRATRRCVRCDTSVPRAGKRVAGGVACPSCRSYFATPGVCDGCGDESTRLTRTADAPGGARLCPRCVNAQTHSTCVYCRRHRPEAGRRRDEQPYCKGCGPTGQASHACPSCGSTVAGTGQSHCRSCLNRSALDREVQLQTLILERPESRAWVTDFASWLHGRAADDPGLVADFLRHVPFVARLDAMLEATPTCTGAWLLEHVPISEQRAHLQFMRFLADERGLVLSEKDKLDAIERDRIARLQRSIRGQPFAPVLEAFAQRLADRGQKLRTQRQYLAVAARFCAEAGVTSEGWAHAQLLRFMEENPGQRPNLGVFVRFCQQHLDWPVQGMPTDTTVTPTDASAKRFREAVERVRASGDSPVLSDLERVLTRAFALRRGALGGARVETSGRRRYLVVNGERHSLPRALYQIVATWQNLVAEGTA